MPPSIGPSAALLLSCCLAALSPQCVEAATLVGRVELSAGPRQQVADTDIVDALVYFVPDAKTAPPKPGRFTIDTHSKGFVPGVLVVPQGSEVAFPNRDTILHHVFSRTPGAEFDLGFFPGGQSRSQVFRKPGLNVVSCNVHHGMRAMVVVMSTPYYARPDADGRFRLEGLPDGPGTLVYWHPRGRAYSEKLTLPTPQPRWQRLAITKPPVAHGGEGARR